MVQVSKQINGGDKMDKCFKQRKLLADEFKKYQKVFVALGDENRQNIFFVLLEIRARRRKSGSSAQVRGQYPRA